jgi:hypothetical protein
MKDKREYVKTQAELAALMPKIDHETGEIVNGISRTAMAANWIKKEGNPGKGRKGFNVAEWREFILSHLEQNESNASGNELDDLKKREQIRNIRTQRARAEEQLKQDRIKTAQAAGVAVPIEEVLSTLAEHCAAVKAGLRNWVEQVSTKRDADLMQWAEAIHDDALRFIGSEIENLERQN